MSRTAASPSRRSAVAWSGLAGISFGALGLFASVAMQRIPFVELFASPWPALPYLAALAAFLVGGVAWWLAVERPRRLTWSRSALVGLLTGLLAHPVMWVLVLVYQDPGSNPFGEAGLTAVLLFTHFGLAFTGLFTIGVGIVCGLALAAARERAGDGIEIEREKLGVVASKYFVAGLFVLPVVLLGIVLPWPLLPSFLLAAAISAAALRRLPVVRTFLVRGYRISRDSSPEAITSVSFLLRHVIVTAVGGLLYLVALVAQVSLSRRFLSESPAQISESASLHVLLPLLFWGIGLSVALGLNYLRNRWEPSRSLRRAAFEWAAFLATVVGSYAAGVAELAGVFRG